MTGSHPDPRASDDDLDPTGVRALLANLPDPGPMPDELLTRISQSLVLEQERRASAGTSTGAPADSETSTGSAPSSAGTDDNVVSLTAERQRRRPGRTLLWLGGAAAVAMVATVSVNQLVGTDGAGDSGVAADIPVTTDSADSGAEAGGAADAAEGQDDSAQEGAADSALPDEEGEAAPQAEPTPAPAEESETAGAGDVLTSTQVQAMAGTVELSTTGWADEVSAWLGADLARDEPMWGATQARDCVENSDLDTRQANTVLLSQALWEDEPATLVVAEATSGDTAWVLSPDCQEIISGPTLLD